MRTSGTILAIEPYTSSHPSGLPEITVIIETDGRDEWIDRQPIEDFLSLSPEQIVEKVYPKLFHHVGMIRGEYLLRELNQNILVTKLSAICKRLSRHYLPFILR